MDSAAPMPPARAASCWPSKVWRGIVVRLVLYAAVVLAVRGCPGISLADEPFGWEIRARVLQGTVRITQHHARGKASVGSGLIFYEDLRRSQVFVLTAWHVVDGRGPISLEVFAAKDFPTPTERFDEGVRIVAKREQSDLAVLRFDTRMRMPSVLTIPDVARDVNEPFQTLCCGAALGEPPTLWQANVVDTTRIEADDVRGEFWLTDQREPFSGESGGPMVDSRGEVVGICSMGDDEEGLYIHLREIHRLLHAAQRSGALPKISVGARKQREVVASGASPKASRPSLFLGTRRFRQ